MDSQQQVSSLCAQDFSVCPGSLFSSGSTYYWVESILGEGTFGKVAKCIKTSTFETVAVKIMKQHENSIEYAEEEVAVLKKLTALDPDTCNIVRWNGCFMYQQSMCLEFEALDVSLQSFMSQRMYQPLSLKEIRPILNQCATALEHLKGIGVIHADLKPDNIMLVDHRNQPLRVKIIDFGIACDVSAARRCSYIQTRWYRSPVVILGLPFTEAIDMWSLGTVAAELFIGAPLYPCNTEHDMLRFIVCTQGQPADQLLNQGLKTPVFFRKKFSSTHHSWRLKKQTNLQYVEMRPYVLKSLDDLKHFSPPQQGSSADRFAQVDDQWTFVDVLKQMLHLDAKERITPGQLLQHPFITMSHLVDKSYDSSYARACFGSMDICRRERQTFHGVKVRPRSTQKPSQTQKASGSTAHLAQQRVPHLVQHAGMSRQAWPLHLSTTPHPSATTQTQSQTSGLKRKRDELEATDTSNMSPPKKKRDMFGCLDRHRNTRASHPTPSTTQASSKSGSLKRKGDSTDEGPVLSAKRRRSAECLASSQDVVSHSDVM